VDVKTTDGYTLRLFCIGFTEKQDMSTKKTAYAQAGQVRNIRKKMIDIMTKEVSSTDLKDVVNKLIPQSITKDIVKACQGIYPSDKAAVATDAATGEAVERPEGYVPSVLESV